MKKIKSFTIYNLWNRKEVSIDLNEQVTFLTGYNGSGKSTVLNILFDTLSQEYYSTSKHRFWACTVKFTDGSYKSKACLPHSSHSIEIAEDINSYVEGDVFSFDGIRAVELAYEKKIEEQRYNLYDSKELGVISIENYSGTETVESDPFLFQDERKCMHNMKNSSIDFDGQYWSHYGIELDQKLIYVLDKLQVYEAKTNKLLSEEIFSLKNNMTKKEMLNILKRHEESRHDLKKLFSVLNSYFEPLGKVIVKDESERIELCVKKTNSRIHWYNLSRGEKTLIYLFLVTFLYKDKTELFIFDEPDIAIHIEWQERLVSDLVSIAPNAQYFIATHSPALIMNGWLDNTKELKMAQ
ncbi:AAA family ATPase [Vibrio fortis]|uniref:AAA family ATPase n=1 Tax=Vibrio fortis TaxID=212667 RepID=UPI0021C3A3E9|nr:ATP-binding protein [Vibrio fortis]